MKFKKEITNDQTKQKLLILLCWLIYTAAYFGRYSYSANINPIMKEYGVSKATAGLSVTMFALAYGIGQVVNGLFCKRYNKRIVLPIALGVSALCNVAFIFFKDFQAVKFLWLVNGAAQSFLWSSVICILSQNMDDKNLKRAIMAMSTTTATGTLLCYLLSALFSLVDFYKLSFVVGAIILAVVAVIFFLTYPLLKSKTPHEGVETPKAEKACAQKSFRRVNASILIFVIVLCALSVFNYFIKDGVNTWMPTILQESYGFNDEISIVFTLALPFASIFAAVLVMLLNKKIKDFTVLLGILFFSATVCLAVVLSLIGSAHWIFVVTAFGLVALLMSCVSNTITSFVPLLLRDELNSSMVTGLFDGCCYLGSALSAYVLGLVTDASNGWTSGITLMCILTLTASVVSFTYALIATAKKKNGANKP